MSNPVWPLSLPQAPLIGYSESIQNIVLRSNMSSGPPKMRNTFTAAIKTYSMQFVLTSAQKATLKTFYLSTIKGSGPFDWTLPDDATAATYRFVSPPQFSSIGVNHHTCSIDVEVLP